MAEPFTDLTYMLAAKQRARLEDTRYLAEYGDTAWHIDDSSWEEYSGGVYFPGLQMMLDEVVANLDCRSSVGIDIAGGTTGRAMRDLLDRGTLNRAAVTTYETPAPDILQKAQNIDFISGNLLHPQTWSKIILWRRQSAVAGLKLAIHEPRNSLQWESPEVYAQATHTLIDNLAPGGIFVSQIPSSLSARELTSICRSTEKLAGVQITSISRENDGYRQALVMKAA